jgi:hypothetical protein
LNVLLNIAPYENESTGIFYYIKLCPRNKIILYKNNNNYYKDEEFTSPYNESIDGSTYTIYEIHSKEIVNNEED